MRGLGWRGESPAKALGASPDWLFGASGRTPPPEASLDSHVAGILDQGDTSSCVAHAVVQAIRVRQSTQGTPQSVFGSRAFVYWNARAEDGGPMADDGTFVRSAFDGVRKMGLAPEAVWPFVETAVNEKPSFDAYQQAFDLRAPVEYRRILSSGEAKLDAIRLAIADGCPVVFGVVIDKAFLSGAFDPTVPFIPDRGSLVEGHAMVVVGYYADGSFLWVNSWGKGWGRKGRCVAARDFMVEARDVWVVAKAPVPGET